MTSPIVVALDLVPNLTKFKSEAPTKIKEAVKDAEGPASESGKSLGQKIKDGVLGNVKGIAAGLAGAFAVKEVKDFATDSVNAFKTVAGESKTLGRTLGVSIEDASRLRFAFSQVGLGTDQATTALKRLELGMSTNSKNWQQLGIDAKDANGNMKPMTEILPQIAEKFKSMPDGAEKTALAIQLFGKSGTNLIPILNKGAAGIDDLMKKSDKMGMTIGKDGVDALGKAAASQRDWKAAMDGVKVAVGSQLLPLMTSFANFFREKLIPILQSASIFVHEHGKEIAIVGGVVVGVVAPLAALVMIVNKVKAVVEAARAAWVILNGTFLMSPIGLIIVAIVALVAAFVILWNKSEAFRNFWIGIWDAIKGAAEAVGHWFTGTLVPWFGHVWDSVKDGASTVVDWFKGLPGKIGDAIGAVVGFITAPFRLAFNGVASLWNNTIGSLDFHVPDWIPGIGGKGFSFPHLPMLAKGGTAVQSGLALVGEHGPEIIRMERGASVIPLNSRDGAGTGNTFNIYEAVSAEATARQVNRMMAARFV